MLNAEHATSIDRRAERTHLFVVATLYFGQASTPVRVRNLSMTGALIEGADLPPVGTEIVLRRGNLEAAGTAIWSDSGRAGLSFYWPVAVSAWLPTKEPTRQAQVDRIAFEVKQGRRALDVAPLLPIDAPPMSRLAAVAELTALQAELGQLADKLSHDMILVATHPEVQFLDAAGQRIGKIIQAVRTAQS